MRSTTAASTWMKPLAPIALQGHRAAPLGDVEATAPYAAHSWRDAVAAEDHRKRRARGCRRREQRRHSDLSVSCSDRDIDRQVQLDETRLKQRHGQVIVQFNPGVGVAWRPPELLKDDLAGLPKR
jgi:hypothetical protein